MIKTGEYLSKKKHLMGGKMKELYLTYCSAEKQPGVNPPEKLDISDRITRFIKQCKKTGVDWAILSALYGFVFPEEKERLQCDNANR